MPNAVLYKDEGVSDFTLNAALNMLQAYGFDCDCVNALDVLNGALDDVDLFIMPGGADEPYHAKLGDEGALLIHDYVAKQGGSYLGLCAGAYYACDRFEFNKGLDNEICRERPLKLFKGWAKGSLNEIAMPYDMTLNTAALSRLDSIAGEVYLYYHGGPVFLGTNKDPEITVLASYNELPANANAAIIYKHYETSGGKVILSGPHFEVEAEDFAKRLERETNPQDFEFIYNGLGQLTTGRGVLTEKILRLLVE